MFFTGAVLSVAPAPGVIWPALLADDDQFYGPVVSVVAQGGGSGNTRKRGWANERAQFEQSQQIQDIAQTLEQSDQPQARRIARKLADYTGELAQVESLRRELAKLEAAQQSRALTAQRDRDLEAAAAELSEILRDDEDVAGALMALHEYEAKLMLGALGIAMR